jgi:hypothetical protein
MELIYSFLWALHLVACVLLIIAVFGLIWFVYWLSKIMD